MKKQKPLGEFALGDLVVVSSLGERVGLCVVGISKRYDQVCLGSLVPVVGNYHFHPVILSRRQPSFVLEDDVLLNLGGYKHYAWFTKSVLCHPYILRLNHKCPSCQISLEHSDLKLCRSCQVVKELGDETG